MVVIARDIERVPVVNFARDPRKTIPNRLTFAINERGSLDLGSSSGYAPSEAFRKGTRIREHCSFSDPRSLRSHDNLNTRGPKADTRSNAGEDNRRKLATIEFTVKPQASVKSVVERRSGESGIFIRKHCEPSNGRWRSFLNNRHPQSNV